MKMPVIKLCNHVGMTRQNFYKARKDRQRREVDEQFIASLVKAERAIQPRIGGLKLHSMLKPECKDAGIKVGRDLWFEILGNQGLLLEPLPKAPRTTDSRHNLPVFTNLIKDLKPTGPNQIWVSDITYIRVSDGFMYLSLVTDMYSRKIVGAHLGDTLEAVETLKALEDALGQLPPGVELIHHSDRGSQYCSHKYVERLQEHGISISMTEDNHCAENSMAERVNGILKQEYYLKQEFKRKAHARRAVREAIELYNGRRPHRSLNMLTPNQVQELAA